MARSNSRKKSNVISVDFTGVESSGKLQDGRQSFKVDGAPEVRSSESGNDYLNWKFKGDGGVVYHTTSLQPQALWNLRNVLEALGLEVPESSMELDLTEVDGLEIGGEIEHEVYQGKKRPRLIDIFPVEELEEGDDDKPSKGKGKEEPEEEEDDELPTYAEVQEADKEELLELAEAHEVKLTVKQKKNVQAMRDAICEALELEEESEEEEDAEEATYESVQEMEKDELLELAEENEIKVPLKTKKDLDALRDLICSELGLEEEKKATSKKTSKKTSSKPIVKGAKVSFTDEGEELEGKVKSVNTKEKFAVIDIDGEEWEVELDDITVL